MFIMNRGVHQEDSITSHLFISFYFCCFLFLFCFDFHFYQETDAKQTVISVPFLTCPHQQHLWMTSDSYLHSPAAEPSF